MKLWTLVLLALALIFSVSANYPKKVASELAGTDAWTTGIIQQIAKGDMIVIGAGHLFDANGRPKMQTIKGLNPNIKLMGIVSYLMVYIINEADSNSIKTSDPYGWDMWVASKPYFALTTTGDTCMQWAGNWILNFVAADHVSPNRALISKWVRIIKKYKDLYPGNIDGVVQDYCMSSFLKVVPAGTPPNERRVNGEYDFDDDDVPFASDANEIALLKQWQIEYFDSIRIVMGNDFIQSMNGHPQQTDADYASRCNGISYEQFATQGGIYSTAYAGYANLLHNEQSGWLRPCLCKTWSILNATHPPEGDYPIHMAICALMTDSYYADGYEHFTSWNLNINAGPPIGPAITTGTPPAITVTRQFTRGVARLVFSSSGYWSTAEFDSL